MKRPILYIVIPFCLGIALSRFFKVSLSLYVVLTALFLALTALSFRKNILSHVFLYITVFLFGITYYQNYNILSNNHIANFISDRRESVTIKGRIVDDPVVSDAFYGKKRTSFVIQSQGLGKEGRSHSPSNRRGGTVPLFPHGISPLFGVTGLVKVGVYDDKELKNVGFGDEVLIEGRLSRPHGLKNPGLFDYSNYLKIKNIYAIFSASGKDSIRVIYAGSRSESLNLRYGCNIWARAQKFSYRLRHRIRDAITKHIDKPYSGFLNAILIGDRNELDSAITDDFVKTGTVHVLAISGLNIVLVVAIFLFAFRLLRIPKRLSLIITAVILVFYSFIAGSNPPVIRATIIFIVFVLGYVINRQTDILNSLSIAAFSILLWNPRELFDPSFQLSFASVLSIILFAPKIEAMFGPKNNYITKSASVSIAATIGVSPIVAGYFNIVSPIAIIANLIIIPALFIITIVSFIFLLLCFMGLNILAAYTGALVSILVRLAFYINNVISHAPMAYFRIPAPSLLFLILYYAAVFYFFYLHRKKRMLVPLLLIANLVIWGNDLNSEERLLKITFLDVGQGDSALLEFPDKKTILIDTGSGGIDSDFDIGKNVVAPYLWNKGIRRLDALIITHFHEDHAGGALYIMNNFGIGCVMDNGIAPTEGMGLYGRYKEIILKKKIHRLVIADGEEITGFGSSRIYVLNPPVNSNFPDLNDTSIVIKLEYKNFGALFCGDISSNAMERIISYGKLLRSAILKVPHHGGSMGKRSVVVRFFEEVSPQAAVVSSGKKPFSYDLSKANYFFKAENYNTKFNGAVSVTTDGADFEARPFCLDYRPKS